MHDSQMMSAFPDWDEAPLAIVADKAYGSCRIRSQIADEGTLAVNPSKSNERHPIPHDASRYADRNIVERFFGTMKDMRRLATRREAQTKLPLHDPHLRCPMLDQLSPHPRSAPMSGGRRHRPKSADGAGAASKREPRSNVLRRRAR